MSYFRSEDVSLTGAHLSATLSGLLCNFRLTLIDRRPPAANYGSRSKGKESSGHSCVRAGFRLLLVDPAIGMRIIFLGVALSAQWVERMMPESKIEWPGFDPRLCPHCVAYAHSVHCSLTFSRLLLDCYLCVQCAETACPHTQLIKVISVVQLVFPG